MISRDSAWELLLQRLKNDKLQKHCISVAAVMEGLASHFEKDKDIWWITGLLHDIDYEYIGQDLSQHSLVGAQWLEEAGYPEEIVQAVRVHNEAHGLPIEALMEKSLFIADAISGLIIATALVLPDKKLSAVTSQNVLNRFKEKAFARGAKREDILRCSDIGLDLESFSEIALRALQSRADELGL